MALKDIKNDPSVTGGLMQSLSSFKRKMSDPGSSFSLPCKSKFGIGDVEQDPDPASALSYFTDTTASNDHEKRAPMESFINSNKYFSTPMPSRERVKKKLTPVMEVAFESTDGWHPQDQLSRIDLPQESPAMTPLYKSFFAAECQEIVNQIEDRKTLNKRKVEEVDVSTIEEEQPPPYDCTPMKSMLACDVDKTTCSLESSPIKEGLSLFGESCLSLEETDMQLDDFDLPKLLIKNNSGSFLRDSERLSLSSRLDGVCAKRQKTKPLETNDGKVSQENNKILSPLDISAASKSSDEKITEVLSNNMLHTEQERTENVMTPGMAAAAVVGQMKASSHTMYQTSHSNDQKVPSTTCIKQMGKIQEHNPCAITDITHVIETSQALTDHRQSITSIHEEVPMAETTQVIEILSPICNTTQDLPLILETVNLANTTRAIEMGGWASANMTLDAASVHDDAISGNITQVMDAVPVSANTTQDLPPVHEAVTAANTTQIIEVTPQILANATQDISSIHEGKTANATHEIVVVPESCVNAALDIAPVYVAATPAKIAQVVKIVPNRAPGTTSPCDDSIPSCRPQDGGVMPKSSVDVPIVDEATFSPCTGIDHKALCNVTESYEQTDNNGNISKEETRPSLNMTLDAPARHSVIGDVNLPTATGTKAEISISNLGSGSNVENKGLMLTFDGTVSNLGTRQVSLVPNDGNVLPLVAPAAQSSVDITCVITDPRTLSPPGQASPNVTEGQTLEGSENSFNNRGPGMMASQAGVDICKDSGNQPLLSESCSMIREEENALDISVFSVGSRSFVTSTPVPGFDNFQYQPTVMNPVQKDHSVSINSVLDDSASKVSRPQRMNTTRDAQGLHCKDKLETSCGSSIPRRMQTDMAPPSEVMPKSSMASTSSIPSARRSLALYQKSAREPEVSNIAQRGAIPGRGICRLPMVRQSLPRASLGNPKLAMEGIRGSSMISKPAPGSRLRTPAATAVKEKSVTTVQLPPVPSSVKTLSRLGVPGTTGTSTEGLNLHDAASAETVGSGMRAPTSTGIGRGLPRPGPSSVRPPLPQSQNASGKPKFQVQALATKKNLKELRPLGSRREIGTSAIRSSVKRPHLAVDSTAEVSSRASSSLNQTVQAKKEPCSGSAAAAIASVPAISTELADSGPDQCRHLEMCNVCSMRHRQFLQRIEELERKLLEFTESGPE